MPLAGAVASGLGAAPAAAAAASHSGPTRNTAFLTACVVATHFYSAFGDKEGKLTAAFSCRSVCLAWQQYCWKLRMHQHNRRRHLLRQGLVRAFCFQLPHSDVRQPPRRRARLREQSRTCGSTQTDSPHSSWQVVFALCTRQPPAAMRLSAPAPKMQAPTTFRQRSPHIRSKPYTLTDARVRKGGAQQPGGGGAHPGVRVQPCSDDGAPGGPGGVGLEGHLRWHLCSGNGVKNMWQVHLECDPSARRLVAKVCGRNKLAKLLKYKSQPAGAPIRR